MKVQTAALGTLEIDRKNVFAFPEGILGFETVKEFALIPKDDSPFLWLQATDGSDLCFVLMSPYEIRSDYQLRVPQTDIAALQAESAEALTSYVIITIPDDPRDMTANFQGPLVFNTKENIARQCISLTSDYGVRHKVLEEIAGAAQDGVS